MQAARTALHWQLIYRDIYQAYSYCMTFEGKKPDVFLRDAGHIFYGQQLIAEGL